MINMEESAAHPFEYARDAAASELQGWKIGLATGCAVLLAIIFFVSGSWKLTDPFRWSQALTQFLVPGKLALPFSLLLGVGEMFGAILIFVPGYRRIGAWLIALLLLSFIFYVGVNYGALVGKDCTCFPLVKRSVGPGFFVGDSVMLLMAVAAGVWSRKPADLRPVLVILGAVAVFAGVSYGINANRQTGLKAPDSITVDGKPYSLQQGHIFVFFYDPECMHCDAAARRMAKLNWKDTQVVSLPTRVPQFAASFLHDTGLKAGTSNDLKLMRETFKFVDPPYGVALEDGRQKVAISSWDESEPAKTLRQIGYVQ
jgi:uncharacterized membrane protein YphA (DoxX/SURF4 family)